MSKIGMPVEKLKKGEEDSAGSLVTSLYAKRTPLYAVYRTDDRVAIHFADDSELQKVQRAAISALNPLRNTINASIAPWRTETSETLRESVQLYDQRIADALVLALEGDSDSAVDLLAVIQKEVAEERTSWGRARYLIVASAGLALVVLLVWFVLGVFSMNTGAWALWFAVAAGVAGAYFSIALAIRNRAIPTALRYRDIFTEAVPRLLVGAIAAIVLATFVYLGLFDLEIGGVSLKDKIVTSGKSENSWLAILAIAFIAGFSERMVPGLLTKFSGENSGKTEAPKVAARSASRALAGEEAKKKSEAVETLSEQPVPEENLPEGEQQEDACLSEAPLRADEQTPDSELPPAVGGVAAQPPESKA